MTISLAQQVREALIDTVNTVNGILTDISPLSISKGGTGQTNANSAWDALGGGNIGKLDSLSSSNIPVLDTSKITTGTFNIARIPTISIAEGGTGQANANAAARALGMAKTAGDTFSMNGICVDGWLTNSRKTAIVSIPLPFRLYAFKSCTVTGNAIFRQNNLYLFGSTSSSAVNLQSSLDTSATAYANGFINLTIGSATEQTSAINNSPLGILFSTLNFTLS